jgi:hypothetical protein
VLLRLFDSLRPAFTAPTWVSFVQVALGWLLTPGRHGVGAALVAGGLSGERNTLMAVARIAVGESRPDRSMPTPEGRASPPEMNDGRPWRGVCDRRLSRPIRILDWRQARRAK